MNRVLIRIDAGDLEEDFLKEISLKALRELGLDDAELSLLITDDEYIRRLNREFRGKDRPTDVLSFPMGDRIEGKILLGDIAISYDTAKRQAKELGHSLREEVKRLLVHGLVHLLGYDHELGGEEEERFFEKEREVLDKL